jgi:hypothetical protein
VRLWSVTVGEQRKGLYTVTQKNKKGTLQCPFVKSRKPFGQFTFK